MHDAYGSGIRHYGRNMTKLLRILTGVHAGAELRLREGTHRVAADDDADIRITDWRGEDIVLAVDATGLVSARRAAAQTAPAADATLGATHGEGTAEQESEHDDSAVLLVDFVPMQFGDTVVCIGPEDATWPSDLELLSTLLVKPHEARHEAERSSRRKLVGAMLGCAMLGAIIVIGSVLITTVVSRAAHPSTPDTLAQRINEQLAAAHLSEVRAEAHNTRIAIKGMVGTAEDDAAVRALIARVPSTTVARQYDIAQNDVRNIEESLGMPGVQVKYTGHGVFEIAGTVDNPSDLSARLATMRHDFSPNIKELRVQVQQSEASMAPPESFSELMASDDIRYAETPDGVKHIYALPEAASDTAAALPAASLGASAALAAASAGELSQPAAAAAASAPSQEATLAANAPQRTARPAGAAPAAPPVSTAFLPLPK